MDQLQSLRMLVAIADTGTLAGGARRQGVSPPAVTRALAALEKRLGAKLVHRTTRSLRLTEVGEQFIGETRRVLAALDAAEAAVTGQRVNPEGLLSITAPELFGTLHIAPLLFEFLDMYPLVRARTFFTNRVVNLIDEGFDLALRIAHLPDSGLTAVPVGAMRVVLVASPSYLEKYGKPRTPADLARHRAIGFMIDGEGQVTWPMKSPRGRGPDERLLVNNNAVKVAAAVAGHGIARAFAYQVTNEVSDGRLRILLPSHEPPPVPVHLVSPAGRSSSAKLREFLKLAVPRLRALPFFNGKGLRRDH